MRAVLSVNRNKLTYRERKSGECAAFFIIYAQNAILTNFLYLSKQPFRPLNTIVALHATTKTVLFVFTLQDSPFSVQAI
jgi:hypothetical protein